MEKFAKYLEQYVEWIALALGVAWLGWMVWGNVLNSPVVAVVGGENVTPDKVDTVVQRKAEELNTKIQTSKPPPMETADSSKRVMEILTNPPAMPMLMASNYDAATTFSNFGPIGPNTPGTSKGELVTQLPVLPQLEPGEYSTGRSTVNDPKVKNADNKPVPVDKLWVTPSWKLDQQALAQAFAAAKIPPGASQTMFLSVEVVREEEIEPGVWGNPVTLKPLPIQQLPDFPTDRGKNAEMSYHEWAGRNQAEIVQPPFYQILKPDFWYVPGQKPEDVKAPQANVPFNPANPGPVNLLNPDQKRQVNEYLKQKAEKERQERAAKHPRPAATPTPSPTPSRGPRGGGGTSYHAAPDPRNAGGIAPPPGGMPMGPNGPMGPGGQPMNPADWNRMTNPQPRPGALAPQDAGKAGAAGDAPAGAFIPGQILDVTIWAHDDTVQPGKTYRYKMKYKLLNPIYGSRNIAEQPKLQDQFALESKFSEWSKPVRIESVSSFFVTSGMIWGKQKVRFEVFKWEDGAWHSKTFECAPGDLIGGKDGKVDYSTGFSVVEFRPDPRNSEETRVVVCDPSGSLGIRDRKDINSEEYKKLQQEAAKVVSASAK